MSTATATRSKFLHITLWIFQVLLGAMFLVAGFSKTFTPVDKLAENMPWVTDFSTGMVRFIGISEFLGGLGLILPSLLRIRPKLTPLAAIGITVIMVLAAAYHISKGETEAIVTNAVIAAAALFIAWGRYGPAPVLPKNRNEPAGSGL